MILEVKRSLTVRLQFISIIIANLATVSNFKICFGSTDAKFLQCFKTTAGAFICKI